MREGATLMTQLSFDGKRPRKKNGRFLFLRRLCGENLYRASPGHAASGPPERKRSPAVQDFCAKILHANARMNRPPRKKPA
jgi:hypothetical protein